MEALKTEGINKLPGEYLIFEVAHENIDSGQSENSTKPRGGDVKELLVKIAILEKDIFEYLMLANDLANKQVFVMKNLQNVFSLCVFQVVSALINTFLKSFRNSRHLLFPVII